MFGKKGELPARTPDPLFTVVSGCLEGPNIASFPSASKKRPLTATFAFATRESCQHERGLGTIYIVFHELPKRRGEKSGTHLD